MIVTLESLQWEELPTNSSADFRSINDGWTYTVNTTKDPDTVVLTVSKQTTPVGFSYQCDEEIDINVLEEKLNELSWKLRSFERLGHLRPANRAKEQTLKHFNRKSAKHVLSNVREHNSSN